jgi:hypothetical protein
MRLRSTLAAGALALLVSTPAAADITVLTGQAAGPLDPVVLDAGALDFIIDGLVGAAATPVTFTGAENLTVQGQRIEASTGTLNFLLFTLTDPSQAFTLAEFNLNAAANGFSQVLAYDQFGNEFGGSFAVNAAGNNFFNVTATAGQIIQSIVIVSTAALDDVRQIRLGGVVTVVPEPTSWAMMILGLGGVGGVLRKRRSLDAVA